jgi:RNA polymerase sigma-70 factor, ECF subfamily
MSDIDAIQAVKSGDKDRYAELVERYQKMVYGITWSCLGDVGLCEDAAQETFIKAFRYLVALRNPEKFPGWLARIARNVSTSFIRKRRRELERCRRWHVDQRASQPSEAVPAEDDPLGETLRQSLADLPEQQRECLVLFYLEGKNIREAAELLGISESAMKTRLHRARVALRGTLEEKLEASLSELGPRKGFSAGVMVLLPKAPLAAAGVGGSSVAAKILSPLAKSVLSLTMVFWMAVAQGAFAWLFYGWLGRLEAANLKQGPGADFRRSLVRSKTIALVIVAPLTLATSMAVSIQFGPSLLFKLLVPFCAWGTYTAVRFLRLNKTPFAHGMALANVTFLLIGFLIGFLHAPSYIFFVAMLPLNIILYRTNKTASMRHDYNLFLRQARGLLGEAGQVPADGVRVTQSEMRSFARFLGERFFVQDYAPDEDGIVLILPRVRPGVAQFFPFSTRANSRVAIGSDGQCEAHLGTRDLRDLRGLVEGASLAQDVLERQVGGVIADALRLFLAGRSEDAQSLLQTEADEGVFVKPIARSKWYRVMGGLAIAAAVFLLLVHGLWLPSRGVWASRKPVSQAMARDAIAEWCRDYAENRGVLNSLMRGDEHPPLNFIGAENRDAYRKAVGSYLMAWDRGNLGDRVIHNLQRPMALYHVLDRNILTKEELEGLGFSPERVREVLAGGGWKRLQETGEPSTTITMADGRSYRAPDVNENAYRLACLRKFGCLDFVDVERIAEDIAAKQMTPGWKIPAGYEPIDTEKAAGLFHFGFCDLRGTRGALWTLQILDKLDLIDKKACADAILRYYKGKGVFRADREDGIHIHSDEDDRFFAMECLHILDALDRIEDLDRWEFEPKTSSLTKDGKTERGIVTAKAITSWAYQLRLEELRGD